MIGERLSEHSLESPPPDCMSFFCAAVLFRISKSREIEFAYVPYRRDRVGALKRKFAGGVGHKSESPLGIVKREVEEELGVELDEDKFHFVFATSPVYDQNHKKIFFVVPAEIEKPLRDTPYDAETGIPEWKPAGWLKENLFGVHKEMFPMAIDFLLKYFIEHRNLEGLLAAVKGGLLKKVPEEIKSALFERAREDRDFAAANAPILEALAGEP
ncbi:MAG: hypothetical protein HZC03_01265 [Candidatus Lloydbacteria bacterium]|nr:hypothetical protein [Candidatus Lloydbacteria bacterium]